MLINPNGIQVFRPKEGEPRGEKEWRPPRKGFADLHRRAQVCPGQRAAHSDGDRRAAGR